MKNAKQYEKKIKKLLTGMDKGKIKPKDVDDPIGILVGAVLSSDATRAQAKKALAALDNEFVDYNELRGSPPRDMIAILAKDYPHPEDRGTQLSQSLNNIFALACKLSIEYMEKFTKRDLRKHLREIGLDQYASAVMIHQIFSGHAIPVDQALVDCLIMNDCVDADTDMDDVQKFLERLIAAKNDAAAHKFFRQYVEKYAVPLGKWRQKKLAAAQAAAEVAAAEEAARIAAIEAKKAAAEARKQAKAEKAAAKAAEKAAKEAAAKKAAKKAAKQAAKKKAKKAAKKTAKKTVKKTAKKSAKKSAKKTVKKSPVKKTAKKTVKKAAKKTAAKKTTKKAAKKTTKKTVKKARKK